VRQEDRRRNSGGAYSDGTFKPDAPVTRAEFAAMVSKYGELEQTSDGGFMDIEGHWASGFIGGVAAKGWVVGYPDGTFKPEQELTRAETVTVANRVFDRRVKAADVPEWAPGYSDLPTAHWAYAEIIEASISHAYTRADDGFEIWEPAVEE
jgi:hypothetical protein